MAESLKPLREALEITVDPHLIWMVVEPQDGRASGSNLEVQQAGDPSLSQRASLRQVITPPPVQPDAGVGTAAKTSSTMAR